MHWRKGRTGKGGNQREEEDRRVPGKKGVGKCEKWNPGHPVWLIKQDAFDDFTKAGFSGWTRSGFQQTEALLGVKRNKEWAVKTTGRDRL